MTGDHRKELVEIEEGGTEGPSWTSRKEGRCRGWTTSLRPFHLLRVVMVEDYSGRTVRPLSRQSFDPRNSTPSSRTRVPFPYFDDEGTLTGVGLFRYCRPSPGRLGVLRSECHHSSLSLSSNHTSFSYTKHSQN